VLLGTGLRFLRFVLGANQSGSVSCKPLRCRLCLKGCFVGAPISQNGFVTNRLASSRLRFVGGIHSGSIVCKPLLLRLCSRGCSVGAIVLQTGFVGNRFAISKLRLGGQPVGTSFLQAPPVSTLFERVFHRNPYFAKRFCYEPVCDL